MTTLIDVLIKFLVNYKYKHHPFYAWSWGIDENTDMYIISEVSYPDRHRFGLKETVYKTDTEREKS